MSAASVLLERIAAMIQQSVRDDAARFGLLPMHVQVLAYLARANRYSDMPIAIAEYFGVTRGTVSQTLGVLERKGYVSKTADAHHGKRVHLNLTGAGEAVLTDSWVSRIDQVLAAQPELTQPLEITLRALLTGLQYLNGQQAFGVCRECSHFHKTRKGGQCGLTGEALDPPQTLRLCREWSAAA
ncbi:helix-turn-helix domain-containing protein [Pseudomonas sp.]|uniref:MarR family winged helix-turn-helix transcriptional regulator n=1 Tax=Pseudomonas sp. TaxID=306 RepID=UPI0023577D7E|nr:helix-turn-helix domain-containing protein [Pseudomonas sp.]